MVKKLTQGLFLLLIFTLITLALTQSFSLNKVAHAQSGLSVEESVNSFHSDIVVNGDGTVKVTETIRYYFPFSRHGIFREIPLVKTNQDGKDFRMLASDIFVADELGRP